TGTDNPPAATGFNPAIPAATDPTQGAVVPLNAPNLGAALIKAGKSFAGYSEDLLNPNGSSGGHPLAVSNVSADRKIDYEPKHSPWVNWVSNNPTGNQLPASVNKDFNEFPTTPAGFAALPTVSFVTPNQIDDEHGNSKNPVSIKASDDFLKNNLAAYAD